MADTGKRIGPTALSNEASTLYAAPALTTFLLRAVHVCNESGAAALLTLSVGADGAGKRLFKDYSVPANAVVVVTTLVPLAAGEVVQAFSATGAGLLTVTLSGVETT